MSPETTAEATAPLIGERDPSGRLLSLDRFRGFIMVLMALDYLRNFILLDGPSDYMNPGQADHMIFLTRWITHVVAPGFFLLAGLSAALRIQAGESRKSLQRYLLTRGLLLILLEVTVVSFGWTFTFWQPLILQVLWSLGVSMILLAACLRLPALVIGALGVAIMVLHPWIYSMLVEVLGKHSAWLALTLRQDGVRLLGASVYSIYPPIPWFVFMAIGFALVRLYVMTLLERRRILMISGFSLFALFMALRLFNGWGDPWPWLQGPDAFTTILNFINVQKYPAQAAFVSMTLGLAFLLMAGFETSFARRLNFLTVFGRAPLFFYVINLYLAHFAIIFIGMMQGFPLYKMLATEVPPSAGVGLLGVYIATLALMAFMYPVCRWYGELKASRRIPLLRYF